MKHTLPQLPYKTEALAPKMSAETFEYHYGKHLQTYIDNLNKLIEGTPYAEMPLDEIVRKADGGVFNNAAQTWNHTFFFLTLTPDQQPMPEKLAAALARDFGSVEAFREAFTKAAVGLFGSGWTWLAQQPDGKLVIVEGPLKGREDWVRKVNHRKRLAYLEMPMEGRTVRAQAGLQIVNKAQGKLLDREK